MGGRGDLTDALSFEEKTAAKMQSLEVKRSNS